MVFEMSVKVLTKGEQTRERLLDIAQDAVLGFASTSIEEIIAEAGITKSGFFYHFRDKNDLAKALLQRYIDREATLFDELFDTPIAQRRPPARLPDFPEDVGRSLGRHPQWPSRMPGRGLRLPGPIVQPGRARAERGEGC